MSAALQPDTPAPLAAILAARIAAHGPITLADYMATALSHPEYGYYRRGDPLGRRGDFTTAPEISQVFGELIGLWAAVMWQAAGSPAAFTLAELGPGRGTLMADALRASAKMPGFHAAASVHLIEQNPALRARQRDTLGGGAPAATWSEQFEEMPARPLILIANEFFDALPVRQYQRTDRGWRERLITHDALTGGFGFTLGEDEATPAAPVPAAAPGEIIEQSPDARSLMGEIAGHIARHGGAALIVDYGPAHSAAGDSLQAVRGHRLHDPLATPGEVDLTAHVDFAALAHASDAAGAMAHGPVPQGAFLMDLGIDARAQSLMAGASSDQAAMIRAGCRRLIDPHEMGHLFKALAVTARGMPAPPGFAPAQGGGR